MLLSVLAYILSAKVTEEVKPVNVCVATHLYKYVCLHVWVHAYKWTGVC